MIIPSKMSYDNQITNILERLDKLEKENRYFRTILFKSGLNILESFIEICDKSPEKIQKLLKNDLVSEESFNYKDRNGNSCLHIICKDWENIKYAEYILDSKMMNEDLFRHMNNKGKTCIDILLAYDNFSTYIISFIADSIEILRKILDNKFMTKEMIDNISFNFIPHYSEHLNILLSCEKIINGESVSLMTQEKFNTIDLNHFTSSPKSIIALLNSKFMTQECFDSFNIDRVGYSEVIRKLINCTITENGITRPLMTVEKFKTLKHKNLISRYDIITAKFNTPEILYEIFSRKEDYARIYNNNELNILISHELMTPELFKLLLNSVLFYMDQLPMLLTSKYMNNEIIYNKIKIKTGKPIIDKHKRIIDYINDGHLEINQFLIKLNNTNLNYIFDNLPHSSFIHRLANGNQYIKKRDKLIDAGEKIRKFMVKCYFEPGGIFYRKQLDVINKLK